MSVAPVAKASLAIINGDFENNAPGSNVMDVDSWFDADANAQSSSQWWLSTWYGPTVSPNGTSVAGLSAQGGDAYLYQSLGVNDGVVISLQIQYDVGSFTDAGSARDLGYTLSIYSVDGTYGSGVDNTDILGATGATLVDEVNSTYLAVAPSGNVTENVATFDITGTSGSELFLRISNNNGTGTIQWESIDNVQIIPEPATIGLVGLAGSTLLLIAHSSQFSHITNKLSVRVRTGWCSSPRTRLVRVRFWSCKKMDEYYNTFMAKRPGVFMKVSRRIKYEDDATKKNMVSSCLNGGGHVHCGTQCRRCSFRDERRLRIESGPDQ